MSEITDEMPAVAAPPFARRRLLVLIAMVSVLLVTIAIVVTRRAEPFRRTAGPIRVSGWAPYWQTDSSLASFTTNSAMFRDVSLFAWSTVGASDIRTESIDAGTIDSFRSAARSASVPFIATIFDGMDAGGLAAVLADPTTRAKHVDALVRFAVDGNFDGLDLDYENFAFSDGYASWATTSPNWVAFISELSPLLHAQGKQLIVSAPPIYDKDRTADSGYWVYDFEAIAPFVDSLRVMAYDYSTSEPGPIAPIDWVKRVVAATKTMVPDEKIMLGVPVYGYNWVVGTSGVCPADQQPDRRNLSTRSAVELTAELGISPTWDPVRAERTFSYTEQLVGNDINGAPTSCSVSRNVWYLDAEAVFTRVSLANQSNLAGVGLWSLGYDNDLTWEGILAAGETSTDWSPTSQP